MKKVSLCGKDEADKAYISREILIMQNINSLHVIKLIDYYMESPNQLNIIMPIAENGSLKALISKGKILSEHVVLNYISQIVDGIEALHANHIIHRDLKPDNILIFDGLLQICDFGVSSNVSRNADTYTGTLNYMGPELRKGNSYSKKVDVWALGCICYELCRLKPLIIISFDREYPNPNSFKMPNVYGYSVDLNNFIRNLLTVDPDKRPDINAVKDMLNKIRLE